MKRIKSREAAEMIGITPATLANWRNMNPSKGPAFIKPDKFTVYYDLSVVEKWLENDNTN